MSGSRSVPKLFDDKAERWSGKYSGHGSLKYRLDLFAKHLISVQPPPGEVLDLGCGTGHLAAHLRSLGYQPTGCDVSRGMLTQARTQFPNAADWLLLPDDWRQLPFEDGRFQAVVASSVMEYVADASQVLQECRRILAPGGVLLFTAPDINDVIRHVEAILTPFAKVGRQLPIRRLQDFSNYLELSRQRFCEEGWKGLGMEAGLQPIARVESSGRLLLFQFRRPEEDR